MNPIFGKEMSDIRKYLFQGADTGNLPISKDQCIARLCEYMKFKNRYKWVCVHELMYVLDMEEKHIITLHWHEFGFHLENDFENLSGGGLEIVLIAINIVFRSICETYLIAPSDRQEKTPKAPEKVHHDDDYWI